MSLSKFLPSMVCGTYVVWTDILINTSPGTNISFLRVHTTNLVRLLSLKVENSVPQTQRRNNFPYVHAGYMHLVILPCLITTLTSLQVHIILLILLLFLCCFKDRSSLNIYFVWFFKVSLEHKQYKRVIGSPLL